MISGITKQQQMPENAEARSVQRRRRAKRALVALLCLATIAIAVVLAVSWHLMIPDSTHLTARHNPKSVPGSLTERDVREISNLCRRHTVRYGLDRLRRGEFGWFFRSTRVLFQQKIDRLMDDRDGTYRVYTVIYDKQAPDGFNAWYRHQLTRTNGHWTILRSY